MAKEKKRGFFSWLGFGQKEQTPEKETEVQNEQPVVEEIVQAQEPVKASEQAVEEQPQAHTEAEAETFAAEVCDRFPVNLLSPVLFLSPSPAAVLRRYADSGL